MTRFGQTLRDLRTAHGFGLRATAKAVGISAGYLSRLERGLDAPPRPEVVKALAKELAADPDVLLRLSGSTDPEVTEWLRGRSDALALVRFMIEAGMTAEEVAALQEAARAMRSE